MAMIVNRRQFTKGVISLALFLLLLIPLFTPVFNGQTGMEAADDLFNSLSKGSSYYIPEVAEEAAGYQGQLAIRIQTDDTVQADTLAKMFEGAGVAVTVSEGAVEVNGPLNAVLNAAIQDSDDLFNQNEAAVETRYGVEDATHVVYYWHDAFKQIESAYAAEGRFADSLFVKKIAERALEPAYNFAGIAAASVDERAGITIFLLAFYIVYTVWYGFSIMFIFEGLGITASNH